MDYTHSNDASYPSARTHKRLDTDVPNNARLIRNLCMGANYLMSHILHFYHLVALDYVDVNGTGLIPKGFMCNNYDRKYYARGFEPVLQTATIGGPFGVPVYTVNDAPVSSGLIPPAALADLTPYFAGQYVRALKMRRLAHQLGAMFAGKMPHAATYTPGCVTTKAYDPTPGGADAAVVQKVHEILYGGPGFDPVAGDNHPYNGAPLSNSNPHPESLLGFIGKPTDFWSWAAGAGGVNPFDTAALPIWAAPGFNAANPLGWAAPGTNWQTYTGTYLFDTVAAAHVFPEYFWFGSGHGRYLAWGVFEGEDIMGFQPGSGKGGEDDRLITRGRTHISQNPSSGPVPYAYEHHVADHRKAKEFTTNSFYDEPVAKGPNYGRHMWAGRTKANPNKAGAYTFAKTPRYLNNEGAMAEHPTDKYLPYEVGPLARMLSNASLINGGPATPGQVLAVNAGAVGLYYPGMLRDVDVVLEGHLGVPTVIPGSGIGVFPGRAGFPSLSGSENLAAHLTYLGVNGVLGPTNPTGFPVFYVPASGLNPTGIIGFHSDYMGGATMDRIAARTLETYYVGMQMLNWFNALVPPAAHTGAKKSGDPGYDATYPYDSNWPNYTKYFSWGKKTDRVAPRSIWKGAGLTEAPRGALGHWIVIGKKKSHPRFRRYRGKVSNYQIITPTAWNINPKDANDPSKKTTGAMGPIEKCIHGTPLVAEAEPIEILRIIHSFDPCCACTVHVMDVKKEKKAKVSLEALI